MAWYNPGSWEWEKAGQDIAAEFGRMGDNLAGKPQRKIDASAFQVPGYQESRDLFAQKAAGSENRQIGADFRQGQAGFINQLQQQAAGQGPSLAGNLLQQGMDRQTAAMIAANATASGVSPALQQRQAMMQTAQGQQQLAGQMANARIQEQMAAQQMLGTALGQARGQDIQTQQVNDQLVQFYISQGMTLDMAQMAANMDLERMRNQRATLGAQGTQQLLGQVIGAGAAIGATAAGGA